MKTNQLTELLNSLNRIEQKKLKSFITSEYHNRSIEIKKLYEFLRKNNFKFSTTAFSDTLVKEIFAKKLNKYRFNHVLNEFTELLYTFLINELFKNNESFKQEMLIKSLFSRKVFNNTFKVLNKIKSLNNSQGYLNSGYYRRNFMAEKYRNDISFLNLLYSRENAFQQISDSADKYFILEKLKAFIMAAKQNRETTLGTDYNLNFKKEITEYISKNDIVFRNEDPLIYCYYLSLKMNEERDGIKYFIMFKKYFFSILDKLSDEELKDFLMDYKDNCDDRTLLDRKRFGNEVVYAYRLMDEKNIFTSVGYISNIDFMNAVITGLTLNKKWALYFFEKYKALLHEKEKEDMLHLVKASILLHEKSYSESLTELSCINSREFYYYLRIRLLRIKIFYELNETDSLFYIIDSVKHYIKRKKNILGANFILVHNFLNTVLKLIKLKNKFNSEQYRLLNSYLKKEELIYAKDWIIDKLKQINN